MDLTLEGLIDRFIDGYTNTGTRKALRTRLQGLSAFVGVPVPGLMTAEQVVQWCASARANNTARGRLSAVKMFFEWCDEHRIPRPSLTERQMRRLRRSYPCVYGKQQSAHPGRWLSREEAYGPLLSVCRDGTEAGLRDEIILRLGLNTVRVTEIVRMTVNAVLLRPDVRWIGKGNRPRKAVAEPALVELLDAYLERYADALDAEPDGDRPLICRGRQGSKARIHWGTAYGRAGEQRVRDIVYKRARQAGLGHVAPHDLRRTKAGILHKAKTPEGAHFFDLLDIADVLDHTDPGTTKRSYIDPMGSDAKGLAASFADL